MEQRFDGQEVALFEGRFRGTFEIPHDVGAGMAIFGDEEYTFRVTVVPRTAGFGETKTGDLKRTNVLEVVSVQYDGHAHVVAPEAVVDVPTAVEGNGSNPYPDKDWTPEEYAAAMEADTPEFGVDTLAGQQELPVAQPPERPEGLYDHDDVLKRFMDA